MYLQPTYTYIYIFPFSFKSLTENRYFMKLVLKQRSETKCARRRRRRRVSFIHLAAGRLRACTRKKQSMISLLICEKHPNRFFFLLYIFLFYISFGFCFSFFLFDTFEDTWQHFGISLSIYSFLQVSKPFSNYHLQNKHFYTVFLSPRRFPDQLFPTNQLHPSPGRVCGLLLLGCCRKPNYR